MDGVQPRRAASQVFQHCSFLNSSSQSASVFKYEEIIIRALLSFS